MTELSKQTVTFSSFQRALLLLYFFSGLTSLAYEVLWARMLSLQFGVSIFGVAVTVSTFMLGLGLGSLAGLRWSKKVSSPLKYFAFFETGVALMALATPWLLRQLEPLLAVLASGAGLAQWFSVQFALIALFLFIPAFFMGAGFPMVLKALGSGSANLGRIYGLNTLGAALGALLPLALLPANGWQNSMFILALGSLLVAATAFYLQSKFQTGQSVATEQQTASMGWRTVLTYAGIGAAAIILEVSWTRLFGMLMLRTEYVLAIILAVFLLGVGLGSLLARHMVRPVFAGLIPLLLSCFTFLGLWLIPPALNSLAMNQLTSFKALVLWQSGILILLTLPVTILLGAWLPWLNRQTGNDTAGGTRLYGANAVGGGLGGMFAAFLLTPFIGTSASIVTAGLAFLFLGMYWCRDKRFWLATPVLLLVAIPLWSMPPVQVLLPEQYQQSRDLSASEDAVNITHVVEKSSGERLLLADLQRMDASSDPTAVQVQKNQARLPLLLHPEPHKVLFLGLGTGISASGSIAYPKMERTAVELSQGAIDASAQWFAAVNHHINDKMTIVRDDARRYLMAGQGDYDVIVGDLFHPDLVGRSALLSVQQFRRARKRLSDDGVFVQWLALNQFNRESLEIVLRSFKQVFPDAVLFVDAFRLAMVGSRSSIRAENSLKNMQRLSQFERDQVSGGEGLWTWLGRYWGPIDVNAGKVQDEWAPQIEFKLPQARFDGSLDLKALQEYLLSKRAHVSEAIRQLDIPLENQQEFEKAYVATELVQRSWLSGFQGEVDKSHRLLQFAYRANARDRWVGFALADAVMTQLQRGKADKRKVLQAVLEIREDHAMALKQLWRLERSEGNLDSARKLLARLKQINPYDLDLLDKSH